MDRTPYPYCPHGAYTGGCGIDHLCQACEMGDLEPTASEQEAYIGALMSRTVEQHNQLLRIVLSCSEEARIMSVISSHRLESACYRIHQEQSLLDEIRKYSFHDDDVEWLYTRHNQRAREWNRLEGEEQFASLPAHVLDGG